MKRMTTDLNCFDEFLNKEKYGPVAEIGDYGKVLGKAEEN
jgi:hypothetical protein